MINPFEEVEPVPPIDPFQVLTAQLSRAMLWDMVGPRAIQEDFALFGQQPASEDVLEAEAQEMWARKNSIAHFGTDFPLLCWMAAESASKALLGADINLQNLSDVDKANFRTSNIKLGTAIAESVVSHMLEKGLIKYGDSNEFLG